MTIWDSLIISIVEGITEFLPISSTGHMIIVTDFLGLVQDDVVTSFETIIQIAAIGAVAVIYYQKLILQRDLIIKACFSFVPIGVIGFLFADTIKGLFSVPVVAWSFIIGGIIFLLVEYYYAREKLEESNTDDLADLTYKNIAWVGIAQVCALVPGVSRAGATIIGGMLGGLNRKVATEFSFLAAIPAMIAVTSYDVAKNYEVILTGHVTVFAVGLVSTFIVAYLSVQFLIGFVQRYTFVIFGWYRIVAGTILLLFFV